MSKLSSILKTRVYQWIIAVLGLAIFFYFVPLFHIVSLKSQQEIKHAALFNASEYVDNFWQGPLKDAAQNAIAVPELLAALNQGVKQAAESYGHRLGLSSSVFFFASIDGYIVASNEDLVSIALEENGPAFVRIEIGPVFGNAIRDGSGLVDVSDFPNAQDFNAISSEINMRVEETVFPALAQGAELGAKVRIVGGIEVSDDAEVPQIFNLVPTHVEFQ